MSNEWIYGEYKGVVDLINEDGHNGPWILLDSEKMDDGDNHPLVQAGISYEQAKKLKEDDDVLFTLSRKDDGGAPAYLIYQQEETEITDGIYISSLRKAS